MQLSEKQIKKIDTRIQINSHKTIVEINVSEPEDKNTWTLDEICYNIYCVDEQYNIIWQIKEIKTTPPFDGKDPFYYLGKNDQGDIIGIRFSGFEYKINSLTGEAEQTHWRK